MNKARFLFGIFIAITIVYSFFHSGENLVRYFSYFTTISNLFMSIFYIYLGVFRLSIIKHTVSLIRSAILGYLVISSLVYIFILHSPDSSYWVIILFHKINPIIFFVDWLFCRNEPKINFREITYWFIFPFAYVIYVLFLGNAINWYPYNFFNLQLVGSKSFVINFLLILFVSIIISVVIVKLGNFRKKLFL